MTALNLNLENKHEFARKIMKDLKELPAIESGSIRLAQFAAKVKSSVSALKALKLTGYLGDPDLLYTRLPGSCHPR